jgi:hypothetical protein
MFFRIPENMDEELSPWDLSVFSRAGEYLAELVRPLNQEGRVSRHILSRLVNGLNRVFFRHAGVDLARASTCDCTAPGS